MKILVNGKNVLLILRKENYNPEAMENICGAFHSSGFDCVIIPSKDIEDEIIDISK